MKVLKTKGGKVLTTKTGKLLGIKEWKSKDATKRKYPRNPIKSYVA